MNKNTSLQCSVVYIDLTPTVPVLELAFRLLGPLKCSRMGVANTGHVQSWQNSKWHVVGRCRIFDCVLVQ